MHARRVISRSGSSWPRAQRAARAQPALLHGAVGNAAVARTLRSGDDHALQRLPAGLRDEMEAAFGESFGDVQVRGDSSDDGLARTTGTLIELAPTAPPIESPEGRFVVAHELAHVVQQRASAPGSAAPPQTLADPALEREADAAAVAAAGGRRVTAGRLTRIGAGGAVTQRFEEAEHEKIGALASEGAHGETRTVELAPGYHVTYGEMVAMGGDHFESIDEIRKLAAVDGTGAGTREEVEYVRIVKIAGKDDAAKRFSDGARTAADQRFNRLAAGNITHFPFPGKGDAGRPVEDLAGDMTTYDRVEYPLVPVAVPDDPDFIGPRQPEQRIEWVFGPPVFVEEVNIPRNAVAAYHLAHSRALLEAAAAGRAHASIDAAAATEAFSAHYLTDSFSGGHVATERRDAVEYWDGKVPMFPYNLQGYLAQKVAEQIAPQTPYSVEGIYSGGQPWNWAGSLETIGDKLGESGAPLTFGAVVALAIHDYFNLHGVRASVGGASVKLMGDNHLGEGDELHLAVAAVKASLAELDRAYEAGAAGVPDEGIKDAVLGPGPVVDTVFAAERLLPRRTPDSELELGDEASIRWDYPSYMELLGDGKFREAVGVFAGNKAGKLTNLVKDEDQKVRDAIATITARMKGDEAATVIQEIVEWVPDTGGGLFGHNQDDNALEYIEKAAATEGGLRSLAVPQRVNLIRFLFDGKTWEDEEDAAWAVLIANPKQIIDVLDGVGRGEIEDELGHGRLVEALELAEY